MYVKLITTNEKNQRMCPHLIFEDFKDHVFFIAQLHDDLEKTIHDINVIVDMPNYIDDYPTDLFELQFVNYFFGTTDLESKNCISSMLYHIKKYLSIPDETKITVINTENEILFEY